jgi:hypothetical protein
MIEFVVGLFLGTTGGVLLAGLLASSSNAQDAATLRGYRMALRNIRHMIGAGGPIDAAAANRMAHYIDRHVLDEDQG